MHRVFLTNAIAEDKLCPFKFSLIRAQRFCVSTDCVAWIPVLTENPETGIVHNGGYCNLIHPIESQEGK